MAGDPRRCAGVTRAATGGSSCRRGTVFALLLAAFSVVTSTRAEPVAGFYAGKTLTLVVGYPPASGYTLYAQMLAKFLGSHIPGRPGVVVQSMPGAGSLKAASYLYNVAPRDGSVLGMFSVGALIDELIGGSNVNYETSRFAWIGNMDESVGVCVVRGATGVRRFEDLRQRETLFGGTGPAGGATQAALALTRLFGARIRLIKGYPGAQDVVLAMDRGEVEGVCGLTIAVLRSRLAASIAAGELVPLLHDAIKTPAELAGVPSVYDLARGEDERRVLDLLFGWRILGRPIAAPPDIPADRLGALQAAFMAATADERLRAEAAKAQLDLAPAPGPAVADLIVRLFSQSPGTIARAAEAVRN